MKKNTILLISLCLVPSTLIFFLFLDRSSNNEIELQIRINQLQIKNDSLKLSNELLDTQIILQKAIADSLNKEIQITNRVIKKLKNVRYERIRAIDSMGNNELLEFFTGFESTGTDN